MNAFLGTIYLSVLITHVLADSPEDQCQNEGDAVCIDTYAFGRCIPDSNGDLFVEVARDCDEMDKVCDVDEGCIDSSIDTTISPYSTSTLGPSGSITTCPSCSFEPDDDDTCNGYIYCEDGSNEEGECSLGYCFNEEWCICEPIMEEGTRIID